MDSTTELMHFPLAVRAVGDAQRIATLNDILRRERVLDAAILEEHPPYFFRGEISSTRLDSYYTHMLLSSLQNYAREAAAGVAFLPSHDHTHLPIGGSLTGELSEQTDVSVVRADFYTLARLTIQSIDTDHLISGIRGGLTRYLSIGWYGGQMICDICGQNYYRRCPHVAGFTYEEEKDGVIRQLLATVGIDDAHLAEVSGVYKGATPGAMIDKVYELASQGELSVDDVRHAEAVYRLDRATTERMLALPALATKHAGVDVQGQNPRKDNEMGNEHPQDAYARMTGQVRAVLDKYAIGQGQDIEQALGLLDIELERLRGVAEQSGELAAEAADGRQYRADLVAEALAEGVRAYGQGFDQETYEATLRAAPLKVVKRMRDDWRAVGDARFAPGRQTAETDEPATMQPLRAVPDSAYVG